MAAAPSRGNPPPRGPSGRLEYRDRAFRIQGKGLLHNFHSWHSLGVSTTWLSPPSILPHAARTRAVAQRVLRLSAHPVGWSRPRRAYGFDESRWTLGNGPTLRCQCIKLRLNRFSYAVLFATQMHERFSLANYGRTAVSSRASLERIAAAASRNTRALSSVSASSRAASDAQTSPPPAW